MYMTRRILILVVLVLAPGLTLGTTARAQCFVNNGEQSIFSFVAPFSPLPLLDRPPLQGLGQLIPFAAGGAVGDFDNDGDQDIFFLSGGVEPDRLYINDGSGNFVDQAPAWGVDDIHIGIGVAVGDVNNDGWLDVIVTSLKDVQSDHTAIPDHRLYINSGNGAFTDQADAWGLTSANIEYGWSPAFGDFDLDGDLDLAIAQRYPAEDIQSPICVQFPNARGVTLLENMGTAFQVRQDLVPDINCCSIPGDGSNSAVGFTPLFVDMDGTADDGISVARDRYPDLLMAIDFGFPRFLVNNGTVNTIMEPFEQASGQCANNQYLSNLSCQTVPGASPDVGGFTPSGGGTGFGQAMGQAVADLNRDGNLDWIYSAFSGENLYVWKQNTPSTTCGNLPLPIAEYEEVSCQWKLQDDVWSWGVVAFDAENDGDVDIAVASLGQRPNNPGKDALFINQLSDTGETTFERSVFTSDFRMPDPGLGIADFDADGDGDRDIIIFHSNPCLMPFEGLPFTTVTLWKNLTIENATGNANWFRLFIDTCGLRTQRLAPNGIGTRVEVTVDLGSGPVTLVDTIDGGSNYLSQSEMSTHFGLGSATTIDVKVYWANGSISEFTGLAANQTLRLKRADLNGDGAIDVNDFYEFATAMGNQDPTADFDGDGTIDMTIDTAAFNAAFTACGGP